MAYALLAQEEAGGLGGSSSSPSLRKVNADTSRKSAEIACFPKLKLPDEIDDFRKSCAKLIWATFPETSLNACAMEASRQLGVSDDTIGRIMNGDTKHPDPRVMFACLAIYQSKTGKAWPIGGGFEIRITQTGAP